MQSPQSAADELDQCIDALHALKQVVQAYGRAPQGQKYADDIADLLLMGAHPHPTSIRRVFGNAIKSNFGTPSTAASGSPTPGGSPQRQQGGPTPTQGP
jgi:hypothetical protein